MSRRSLHLALILVLASASFAWGCGADAGPGAVAGVAAAGPEATDADIDRAGQLLAEGRADEAWSLLVPLAATRAGDTEFDFVLALAALDSGRAAAALAPLRRILAVEPRFDGARMELARALAATGDAAGARREYQWIAQRSPSEASRAAATRALVGLPGAPARRRGRQVAALVAGAGYDSNANASTSQTVFGFTLDPRAIQQASPFAEVGGSLRGEYVPAAGLGLVTLLRAGHRLNPDARFIDQTAIDAGIGLNTRFGAWKAGMAANLATGWLDGASYFDSAYLEASASRPIDARWEVVGVGRASALDYRQARFEPLDVRRYVWGVALQRRATAAGIPLFGAALLGGQDDTRDPSSPWSNDRYGARVFGAWPVGTRRALFGELAWLTSDFFGARGFFGVDRLDRQVVAALGLEAREWPARGWRVVPQVRYTDNRSNFALYSFDRIEAAVFVRREFD